MSQRTATTTTRTLRQHVPIVQDLSTSSSFDYKINLSFSPDEVILRELQYYPYTDGSLDFDQGMYRVTSNMTPQDDTLGFVPVGLSAYVDVSSDEKGVISSEVKQSPLIFFSNPQTTYTLTNFTNNIILHLEFSKKVSDPR
jgi:hypothetical protein